MGASPGGGGAQSRASSTCRLRLNFGSPGAGGADSCAGPAGYVTGLAPATLQENQKADRLEETFQRVRAATEAVPQEILDDHRGSIVSRQGPEALTGVAGMGFEEDLKHFEGLLEELGKSLRMERLLEVVESSEQIEQAEEEKKNQRQRERKQRDVARQQQLAAHPRRRLALRLERCREVGAAEQIEITGNNNIPLKKHLVLSGHSFEKLEIVNVPILQKRCLGVAGDGSSTSYKTLRRYAELEEKRHQWEAAAFAGASQSDYVKGNMCGDSLRSRVLDNMSSKMAQQEVKGQVKQKDVTVRRREFASKECRRKEDAVVRGRRRSLPDPASPQKSDASPCSSPGQTHARESRHIRASTVGKLSVMAVRSKFPMKEQSSGMVLGLSAARARGLSRWRVLRSVLCALWLLQEVRARHWASGVVRSFMATVQKLQHAKLSARRINGSVRKLQTCFRGFMHRKRRWCESVTKQWMQYEDQYLQSSFKVPGHSVHRSSDEVGTEVRAPSRRRAVRAATTQDGPDWRSYRVPPAQRRFTLGRWYIVQVRQWVEKQECWASLVSRAIQQQTDLANYMKLCGIEPSAGAKIQEAEPSTAELPVCSLDHAMGLGEPETLDLIRLAVSELMGQPPFMNHPANKSESSRLATRTGARLLRILKKRQETLLSRRNTKKVGVQRKRFSIDTMEQADYSEALGERRQSTFELDEHFPTRYHDQLQPAIA